MDVDENTLPFQQCHIEKYDIGNFFENTDTLSDDVKFDILGNVWKPSQTFQLPSTESYGKKKKFNAKWLDDFPWLTYSSNLNGAFCLPCVFLADVLG